MRPHKIITLEPQYIQTSELMPCRVLETTKTRHKWLFFRRFDVAGVHPDNKKPGAYTQVPYFIGTGVCILHVIISVLSKYYQENIICHNALHSQYRLLIRYTAFDIYIKKPSWCSIEQVCQGVKCT